MRQLSGALNPKQCVWVVLPASVGYGRVIFEGASRRLRQAGVPLRLADDWRLPKVLEPPGAAVITLVGKEDEMLALRAAGRVVVNLSSRVDSKAAGLPAVVHDNRAAGRLAAEHLLSLGLRRLATMPNRSNRVRGQRIAGFVEAASEAGVACVTARELPGRDAGTRRSKLRRMRRWLESLEPPTGLLLSEDVAAKDILPLAADCGLRVPEDMAVIGVNNDELVCESLDPPLSSVDMNGERMGYEAASLVMRLLDGAPPGSADRDPAARDRATPVDGHGGEPAPADRRSAVTDARLLGQPVDRAGFGQPA